MVQTRAYCMRNTKHTGHSDCYLDYNSTGWKTGLSSKRCFALGLPSQGKPWGVLLKDVNSTCIMTLGLLKQERLKCILVSPWRRRKANYVYHNTFHPLAWGIFHPVSSHSVPESYSLRPLPADPDFCTSGRSQPSQKQEDSFPPKIRFDPWKSGRKKGNN